MKTKMKLNNLTKATLIGVRSLGSVLMSSCADELDLTNPNQYGSNGFWKTEAAFTGNLVALMNQWRANYDQNVLFQAGEFRTDYYWTKNGTDGSGLRNTNIPLNLITEQQPQFTKYGNFYGMISNCNTYIYYDAQNGESVLTPECRNYLLGMIYGMRAYCFFQIHKMWGTGPLRTNADVILGNYDEVSLQMPRSTAEEMLNQIKSDIKASLDHFNAAGNYSNSVYNMGTGANFWRKATTEMLAGEVYLWSGKVSTLDHKANPADVATAKTYFNNVVNNYGFQLAPTYYDAINGTQTTNKEYIFATYYATTEATTNWFNYINYDVNTGGSPNNFWNCVQEDGITPGTTANRLTYWYNPLTGTKDRTPYYMTRMSGQQHQAVRNAYYYQFDARDSRRNILNPIYLITPEEKDADVQYIPDFNFDEHILAGCYAVKYRGTMGLQGAMVGTNYMPYYRLALAYMYLAEIANYEDNKADVEKYINMIRKRAYGDNWNEATDAYVAGDFKDNEIAILQEKAKEFFQEGQRWWDLRRLTTVKGGTDKDHLIFCKEGCLGYGLTVGENMYEVTANYETLGNNLIETETPLLDYATQKHLVLWPLDGDLLDADPALTQTPGYTTNKKSGGPWIEN